MLRVELTTQLLRVRTLIALACLAAVPVIGGLATVSHAGHRDGTQGGLFGSATYSALNHAMASLEFTGPLLLPLAVALLASAIGSADRAWGTLRYLYVQPVNRSRLLAGKLGAVMVTTSAATGCVLLAGLLAGLALFGWHPFHIIGAPNLATSDAIIRSLIASAYILLCMLSIEPAGTARLGVGVIDQAAVIVVATGVSVLVLLRRDPAALPLPVDPGRAGPGLRSWHSRARVSAPSRRRQRVSLRTLPAEGRRRPGSCRRRPGRSAVPAASTWRGGPRRAGRPPPPRRTGASTPPR